MSERRRGREVRVGSDANAVVLWLWGRKSSTVIVGFQKGKKKYCCVGPTASRRNGNTSKKRRLKKLSDGWDYFHSESISTLPPPFSASAFSSLCRVALFKIIEEHHSGILYQEGGVSTDTTKAR